MENLSELTGKLDQKEFKLLFKTKPLRHAAALLLNWGIILSAVLLCLQFPNFLLYFLAVLVIGARMHALAILTHDAAHYRFLKNKKWNDLITNVVSMYPMFLSVEKYRNNHLKHHNHLNTEDDPDWVAKIGNRPFQFPKTRRAFLTTVIAYLTLVPGIIDAFTFMKRFGVRTKKKKANSKPAYNQIAFNIILFSSLTLFGAWKYYLLFWIVPYFSTFFMFQYVRSVAEHFGDLAYEDALSSSRTIMPTLIEQFFIAPHNVGFHLDHHLYPAVPFYNLPKLHQLLMQQADYRDHAHITHGFASGLLQELERAERNPAEAKPTI